MVVLSMHKYYPNLTTFVLLHLGEEDTLFIKFKFSKNTTSCNRTVKLIIKYCVKKLMEDYHFFFFVIVCTEIARVQWKKKHLHDVNSRLKLKLKTRTYINIFQNGTKRCGAQWEWMKRSVTGGYVGLGKSVCEKLWLEKYVMILFICIYFPL